jgi:mRNA interferase MazF
LIERGAVFIASEKGVLTRKPRPVLILQSDEVNAFYPTITLCLISATLTGQHVFRVPVAPSARNGLREPSEVQADRIFSFQRESLDSRIGELDEPDMTRVETALRLWLDF